MAFGWNTDASHDTDAKRSGKPSNYAIANASCLEFARKKPLNWWLDQGIKEGVALMLCNSVKRWRDWRSAEAGKSRKVERVVNAIGMDEYRVITVCPSEKPVDDLLPDLPMLGPLPYMYDTELLPFSDDIDGLQRHDEAQSDRGGQVLAQRLLKADEDDDISQILAQGLLEANDDEE